MTINEYICVDSDENEHFRSRNHIEAREYAQKYGMGLVEEEYEYTDSSLIEDYRETKEESESEDN